MRAQLTNARLQCNRLGHIAAHIERQRTLLRSPRGWVDHFGRDAGDRSRGESRHDLRAERTGLASTVLE
jgi:hypothetical protein